MFFVIKKHKMLVFMMVVAVTIVGMTIFVERVLGGVSPAALEVPPGAESRELPIIMYHSIVKDTKSCGTYTITPDQFESDLAYIKERGYTTVNFADVIGFVYENKPLPEKIIMLTFDDGNYNNLYYAEPLLKKYGMKAAVFVVGKYSETSTDRGEENPNFSYLTWDHMKELVDSGIFEVQNHTYDMHNLKGDRNGAGKKYNESKEEYAKNLTDDLTLLQNKVYDVTGVYPTAFAYPFGNINRESVEPIKEMGLKASVTSYKGISTIYKDWPDSLFLLKRHLREYRHNTEPFFDKILK